MLRYVAGTALVATVLSAVPLAPASADQGRHAALGLGLLGGAVAGAAIAGAQSGSGGHSSEGSTVIVQQQPVYVAPQTVYVAPSAGAYYYCSSPQGYYPYVAICQTPWQMVPATPAPSVAPPPAR